MTDNTDDIAIKVSHIDKSFKLPHDQQNSLKGKLINFRKSGYEVQHALKDISFEVKKGEFFGIVGRNGSGKSTLLKILAGIYVPNGGDVHISGALTPFIELGVGFNPELSGRDNVFLNGALLGFNRKEMTAMYDEIVGFAELERFMDQKLKNYSSGMQVRLAFSIAIRANTDILVLDEVLAVGDANFQQKCFDYFEKIKKEKRTIILVTHDMGMVRRFCDRALLIEYGVQKAIGSPDEVTSQYTLDNMNTENVTTGSGKDQLNSKVKTLDVIPKTPLVISNTEDFEFDVVYELSDDTIVDIGMSLIYQGQSVIEHSTRGIEIGYGANKKHVLTYKLPLKYLNPGRYEVSVAIFEKKEFKLIGFNADSCSLIIEDNGKGSGGILSFKGEWSVKR